MLSPLRPDPSVRVFALLAACNTHTPEQAERPETQTPPREAGLLDTTPPSLATPGMRVLGTFAGTIDPTGGPSTIHLVEAEPKSNALPGYRDDLRQNRDEGDFSQQRAGTLRFQQDEGASSSDLAVCEQYWLDGWAIPGWRFGHVPANPPEFRETFFADLATGGPGAPEPAPSGNTFCTIFQVRNDTGEDIQDLWILIDELTLDGARSFVSIAPRVVPVFAEPGTFLRLQPDSNFGMFNYGPLAADDGSGDGETVAHQWMFYLGATSPQPFRVRGRIVEILHEDCSTTTDDNLDGLINSGCGIFSANAPCFIDDDCLSDTCIGGQPGDPGTLGTCALSTSGQPCLESDDCAADLLCAGAIPAETIPGTCTSLLPVGAACTDSTECASTFCDPVAGECRLLLGEACAESNECSESTWCPTSTTDRFCAPLPDIGGVVIPFQFVPTAGAAFEAGSPNDPPEHGRFPDEQQRWVGFTRNLAVGRTPITQGQWRAVASAYNAAFGGNMGLEPSGFARPDIVDWSPSAVVCDDDDCPVERISWMDAAYFANALSALEGLDPCYTLDSCFTGAGMLAPGGGCDAGSPSFCGATLTFTCLSPSFNGTTCNGYRLPTEAEWEFMARAGTSGATPAGELRTAMRCPGDFDPLDAIAVTGCNAGGQIPEVGSRPPNTYGLFDTIGTVWEWTSDRVIDEEASGIDPVANTAGGNFVHKGGSFTDLPRFARVASRLSIAAPDYRDINRGLRLVRTLPADEEIICPVPPLVVNGTTSGIVVNPPLGHVVEYACDPGFVLVGNPTRACSATGQFSGDTPECLPAVGLGEACTHTAQCPDRAWCNTEVAAPICSPRPIFNEVGFHFAHVPSGGQSFLIGSPPGEPHRRTDTWNTENQASVTVTEDIWVGRTLVTNAQWREVVLAHNDAFGTIWRTEPSWFLEQGTCPDDECPVERVNWFEAMRFANALSALEGLTPCYSLPLCTSDGGMVELGSGCLPGVSACANTGAEPGLVFQCSFVGYPGNSCEGYRLATEAEWEFAARGGVAEATYAGPVPTSSDCADTLPVLGDIARYTCNSTEMPFTSYPVARYLPNAYGLYDMLGNLMEITFNPAGPHLSGTDPAGDTSTINRTRRGGWAGVDVPRAAFRNSAHRNSRNVWFGVRLVRTAPM